MSGNMMSQYILEEDQIYCDYPDQGHCPVRCMSRSFARESMRLRNIEQSIREIKDNLEAVVDNAARGAKSSSSDSDRARDKKKAKKGKKKSRSGSDVIGQDQLDIQASLERDFAELLTWKHIQDDMGGRPKMPRCCPVILKSATSSEDGCTSGDELHAGATDGDDIERKVSQVIDDMAQVADDIQVTAGISEQVVADMAGKRTNNLGPEDGNADELAAEEDKENTEPEYIRNFLLGYNDVD